MEIGARTPSAAPTVQFASKRLIGASIRSLGLEARRRSKKSKGSETHPTKAPAPARGRTFACHALTKASNDIGRRLNVVFACNLWNEPERHNVLHSGRETTVNTMNTNNEYKVPDGWSTLGLLFTNGTLDTSQRQTSVRNLCDTIFFDSSTEFRGQNPKMSIPKQSRSKSSRVHMCGTLGIPF